MNQTILLSEHIAYSAWIAVGVSVLAILSHHLQWNERKNWGKYAMFFEKVLLMFVSAVFAVASFSVKNWMLLIPISVAVCVVYGVVRGKLRDMKFKNIPFRVNGERFALSNLFILPYTALLGFSLFGVLFDASYRGSGFEEAMVFFSMATGWGLVYGHLKPKSDTMQVESEPTMLIEHEKETVEKGEK